MTDNQRQFPSRFFEQSHLEGMGDPAPSPTTINQHVEPEPDRAMSDEETARLLHDPMGALILRRGNFPSNLTAILEALDGHNDEQTGLPETKSYLISEGGQIPFAEGLDKGHSRLIVVRLRDGSPHMLISTLVPAGVDPRADSLLLEVIGWDPDNKTMHFYQRQEGMWFWCGQSDMALVAPTRGQGPFDSHVNGYVVMKELKAPWTHWHGPDLQISHSAFAADDPILADPLFRDKEGADGFEFTVVRQLAPRWNQARFTKAFSSDVATSFESWGRQILDTTTINLRSSATTWQQARDGAEVAIPETLFFDSDCLSDICGLGVRVPTLAIAGARYAELAAKYDLRVIGDRARSGMSRVDIPGDVPFALLFPERSFEDTLATSVLVENQVVSARLVACLLMVDFANPIFSESRQSLLRLLPADAKLGKPAELDDALIASARANEAAAEPGTPVGQLLQNWDVGDTGWREAFSEQLSNYLGKVAQSLLTPEGSDEVFRLAESRRREFKKDRPLAEFGLTLPQCRAVPATDPPLRMAANGRLDTKGVA